MKFCSPLVLLAVLMGFAPLAQATQANDTTITITSQTTGPTPFISKLGLSVSDLTVLSRIKFAVRPKDGSVTRPLAATYAQSYLNSRGYVDSANGAITVPVFGLYASYTNTVTLTYFFADGSSKTDKATITTAAFDDTCHYNGPKVFQARTASRDLSYDFMLVTTNCSTNSPMVIDTDGAIRWVGTAGVRKYVSTFFNNAIYIADEGVLRMELDGTVSRVDDLATLDAIELHHSMNKGKYGLILDVNTDKWVESVNVEIDASGHVLKRWEIGEIIRQAMIDGGDDPAPFVREAKGQYDFHAPEDWFHNNSAWYRKSDDSLILSSRENFVICLDYESGAIKWILGDPKKQWYQYPSLRKYALALAPGSHPPIGQHCATITQDDHLLLFDNGQRSQNHAPYGASRSYSAPRKYALDLVNKTATEVWSYNHNPSIFSGFRSSIFEDAPLNYLIHYSNAPTFPRIIGLAKSGEKVFEYGFSGYAFRSIPVHWERLMFVAPVNPPAAADSSALAAEDENE